MKLSYDKNTYRMKKVLLLLFTVCIAVFANAQIKKTSQSEKFKNKIALDKKFKALTSKPQMEKFYFWDSTASQWNIARTTEFSYNSFGLIEQLISKDPLGVFVAKETNTYSAKNLTENVVEQWNNNSWENSYRVKIWYDSNSEPIKEESSSWNNNEWEVFFGFSSHKSFDPLTSIETITDSMFDGTSYSLIQKTYRHLNSNSLVDTESIYSAFGGTGLEPSYRNIIAYNSNHTLDSMIQQIWDGFNWQNDRSVCRFEYDNQDRILSFRDNLWDGLNWIYTGKTENNYFPHDGLESIEYINVSDTLIYYKRYKYLNDSLYNQILSKYEDWDGTNWISNMYETNTYIYDSMGNILEDVSQVKNFNGNLTNNIKREYFNYILLGINHSKNTELVISPNPTTDKIKVIGLKSSINLEVKISDIQGNLLKTIMLDEINEIDMMDLAKGIYLLKIDGEVFKVLKN